MSLTVLTLVTTLGLAACGSSTGDRPARLSRLTVATTVAPITSIAASIAGDRADVVGIVPEGTNSHTFEPPPQTAKLLERADVVLVNGLQLEEPTFELAEANKKDGAEIIKIGEQVLPESEYIYDFSFPKEDGKPNPHLWTDPHLRDQVRRRHQGRPRPPRRRPTRATTRPTTTRSWRRRPRCPRR